MKPSGPLKKNFLTMGVDDGSFTPRSHGSTVLVGVVMRGNCELEAVLTTSIGVDGFDATEKLAELVDKCRQKTKLSAVLTNGLTFGGFNVLDLEGFSKKTGLGVLAVSRKLPDMNKVEKAVSKLPDSKKRLGIIRRAGKFFSHNGLVFQKKGISMVLAKRVLERTVFKSVVPEPVRAAHLVAGGVSKGVSSGRV